MPRRSLATPHNEQTTESKGAPCCQASASPAMYVSHKQTLLQAELSSAHTAKHEGSFLPRNVPRLTSHAHLS